MSENALGVVGFPAFWFDVLYKFDPAESVGLYRPLRPCSACSVCCRPYCDTLVATLLAAGPIAEAA